MLVTSGVVVVVVVLFEWTKDDDDGGGGYPMDMTTVGGNDVVVEDAKDIFGMGNGTTTADGCCEWDKGTIEDTIGMGVVILLLLLLFVSL